MSTMDFVPSQIDYTTKKVVLPKIKYNRIPLNNTTSSGVTVSTTTTQLLEFKIPPNTVFNLARTLLQFQYTVPDLTTKYNFVHENPEFQNIQLVTAQNVVMADVQNCHYSNFLFNKLNIQKEFVMTGSTSLCAQAINNPKTLSYITPAALPGANTTTTQQSNLVVTSSDNTSNNVNANDTVNQLYTDVLNYQVGAVGNGGGGQGNLTIQRQYDLSRIGRGTILELDKDLCFMQELYLRLWISPGQKIAWTADSIVPNNAPVLLASPIAFSNIYLYLATESNMLIADSVRAKASSGMSIPVKYLTTYRFGIAAPVANSTTSANVVINLNSSNGQKLKNITWSVFDGTESGNRIYNCSNTVTADPNANKLTNYRTYLNNQPETDYLIDLSANDDWRENKRRLLGTLIGSTLTNYKYNWHHMSRYGSVENVEDLKNDANVIDGVDLVSSPVQYTIQAVTGQGNANNYNLAGLSLYAFVETQKILNISPQGITFA